MKPSIFQREFFLALSSSQHACMASFFVRYFILGCLNHRMHASSVQRLISLSAKPIP